VVEWATTLLEGGLDTPNLRILAGLSPADRVEVEEYLDATLADLGERPITSFEQKLGETRAIAIAIVLNQVDPEEGVRLIHRRAVSPLGHPQLLQPWCDLDGGFVMRAGIAARLEGAALAEEIRAFATGFGDADPAGQLEELIAEMGDGTRPDSSEH
jgi:hypothetical protein